MKPSATTACRHSSSKGASIINKNAPLISMSLHLSPPPIALPPHSKSFSPLLHSPSLFCPSLPFSVSQILHNPIRFWMLRTEPKPRASERTAGTPQPQGHREARERKREEKAKVLGRSVIWVPPLQRPGGFQTLECQLSCAHMTKSGLCLEQCSKIIIWNQRDNNYSCLHAWLLTNNQPTSDSCI